MYFFKKIGTPSFLDIFIIQQGIIKKIAKKFYRNALIDSFN
ncbi:hypothetical protein CP10139811_0524 [Chlamydia ibidis]|uniref:Uncharacterized protein n=2 Tax=Chlamydia ibidis TaxID=1405396 RepID=S7KJV2_9CHLA|nr:hypothetical protein CP10139811_0524 [Chlamydia ibidis]EQM62334.1 hypothetical protein H359_0903 [Chlamydia ibidis 10-1398/6]